MSIQGELLGEVPYSKAFVGKARFLLTVIKTDPNDKVWQTIRMALSRALCELGRKNSQPEMIREALRISEDMVAMFK